MILTEEKVREDLGTAIKNLERGPQINIVGVLDLLAPIAIMKHDGEAPELYKQFQGYYESLQLHKKNLSSAPNSGAVARYLNGMLGD